MKNKILHVNAKLQRYIEDTIFPAYSQNDKGHQLEHIQYVIRRSLFLMDQLDDLDVNMVYTIAAYHDIAHHLNKDQHEILSAQVLWMDDAIKQFFTEEQRKIIREAIEDHRASSTSPPRSDYGKLISSADRSTDLDEFFRRTHAYSIKHYPDNTLEQNMERCYHHMRNKYGKGGYAKSYVNDEEYLAFSLEIQALLKDRSAFECKYLSVISEP